MKEFSISSYKLEIIYTWGTNKTSTRKEYMTLEEALSAKQKFIDRCASGENLNSVFEDITSFYLEEGVVIKSIVIGPVYESKYTEKIVA